MPYLGQTACCGVEEIDDLAGACSAQDAMLEIISECIKEEYYDYRTKKHVPRRLGEMPAHIIFTEIDHVNEVKGNNTPVGYGKKFAAFIVRHKLGKVVKTKQAAPNRRNHPTHMLNAYLWTPDPEGITKWFKTTYLVNRYYEENPKRFTKANTFGYRY